MRRFIVSAAAVLCTLTAASAIQGSASASTATFGSNWQSWRGSALSAAGGYRDHGPVTMTQLPSGVSTTSVVTASGVIAISQETVVAHDDAGTVVMDVASLGGRQLVVTEMSPTAGYQGAILVLQPGTSTVARSYPLAGTTTPNPEAVYRHSRGPIAHLVTVGGCYGAAYNPTVIGSIFGLLVQGEGTISCGIGEDLSAIVSLYIGSTHVGTTAGGTDVGTYLAVNSYFGCISGGPNTFHTAELWAVGGVLQGGGTSGGSTYGCQS